jgi:hypothetical protein
MIVKFKEIMKNTHKYIVKVTEEFMFVFDNSQIIIVPKFGTEQNASFAIKGSTDFDQWTHCVLVYIQKPMPYPMGMHRLEGIANPWDIVASPHACMYQSMSPNFSGSRVNSYMDALWCAESLTVIHRIVSSCKQWENMPRLLHHDERCMIQEATQQCRPNLLADSAAFQQAVVDQWNPYQLELIDLFICPLSLKDDMKQRDVGMIALELFTMGFFLDLTTVLGHYHRIGRR